MKAVLMVLIAWTRSNSNTLTPTMTGKIDELQKSAYVTTIDPSVNAAFVGDDGKIIIIDVPLHNNDDVLPSSKIPIKEEIDYSKATTKSQLGAALSAAFSSFLLGTAFGWSSPVQPQLQQVNTTFRFDDVKYQTGGLYMLYLDDDQMSWVGSLLNIGALFGALSGGLLMDRFGRRFVLMTMTSPYIIGWLMITLAIDPSEYIVMLYVGRVIVGFAGGVCAAIAPCYIGRQSDARRAMEWLRGPHYSIEAELNQIKARVLEDSLEAPKLSDFYQPWVFKPILIGVALMILQQFSGLNAASFNASEIFRIANLDFNRRFLVNAGIRCLLLLSGLLVVAKFCQIQMDSFSVFNGGLPWLISSEILPAKYRGPGSSIVAFSNFLMSFIVTKTFIDMQRLMTHAGVFWFYSKTKDKTSNQIQAYFKSDKKS
uniref:Major facilitator superfamily (MFS) profile domain-containing protein n=1 Tax=Daphnia galeata TaxID=27404 RepID=A0A8J2S0L9_9CRUS|nr:unnamed protein product [Daphnia galeata]